MDKDEPVNKAGTLPHEKARKEGVGEEVPSLHDARDGESRPEAYSKADAGTLKCTILKPSADKVEDEEIKAAGGVARRKRFGGDSGF